MGEFMMPGSRLLLSLATWNRSLFQEERPEFGSDPSQVTFRAARRTQNAELSEASAQRTAGLWRTQGTGTEPVQGSAGLDRRDNMAGPAVTQHDKGAVRVAQHPRARFAIARRKRME